MVKKKKVNQMDGVPFLFDVGDDRVAAVTEKRGKCVSALMKSIRLGRTEDSAYWMLALLRGGQDRAYLGRRCFGSACEDSLSIPAMEIGADLAKQPAKASLPYLQSAIASSRGLKWYSPIGKRYTLARCEAYEGLRIWEDKTNDELMRIGETALERKAFVPFFVAYRELKTQRKWNIALLKKLLEAGVQSGIPEAVRLARVIGPNLWQCATRENNPVWQLMWVLCHGPFPGSLDPVNLEGTPEIIERAEARWAAPEIEAIPSWALDGVHTTGDDERFAGTWAGLRNCVAMFERYGRLSPDDEGVLIKAGHPVTKRSKGMWPVSVESETHPGVFYDLEPDGDEFRCSCPEYHWQSRKGVYRCSHLQRFLAANPTAMGG